MRVIDADYIKKTAREKCKECNINGSNHCRKYCIINEVCDLLDAVPTVGGLINAQDFRKRIHNHEYVYIQACANDVLDAIDCEVTYFKEKQNHG